MDVSFSPCSMSVGTSGSTRERVSPVTASPRTLPASMSCLAWTGMTRPTSTVPATSAFVAGPSPANGTWTIWMPEVLAIIATVRWGALPSPALPKFSLPGLALA